MDKNSDKLENAVLSDSFRMNTFFIHNTRITILRDKSFFYASKTAPRVSNRSPQQEIHYHLFFEFFFIFDGSLTVQSEEFVTKYESGTVCIPPMYRHFSVTEGSVCRLLLQIPYAENIKNKDYSYISEKLFNSEKIVSFPFSTEERLYLNKIIDLNSEKDYFAEQQENCLFALLFMSVIKNNVKELPQNRNFVNYNYDYLTIENAINNSFRDNPTLADIARAINRSSRQTSRIIRKYYNKSLDRLILEKKLSIAKMYLMTTDLKISEIIEAINFKNANYFYGVFKKAFGITPLQFRKKNLLSLSGEKAQTADGWRG